MIDMHAIIYAFHASPELGALQIPRTAASLPYCGGYRLIDFSLSSMMNAGVRDVGVIMQRDYQSLLDHLSGAKEWNLTRRDGGLRMLPPFGSSQYRREEYSGCMEALIAVRGYIADVRQKHVILTRGNVVANIDIAAAYDSHVKSGAEITAICSSATPERLHHRYIVEDGVATKLLFNQANDIGGGVTAMEIYIIEKEYLLRLIDYCNAYRLMQFHLDAVEKILDAGRKINIYMHEGYWRTISTAGQYFESNMDMLSRDNLREIFMGERTIRTREHADVSTHYGEQSRTKNCLVADGCKIDGDIENCIIFRGVVIEQGAKLKNCIVLQGSSVARNTNLKNVICDKNVKVQEGAILAGLPTLPYIVPKDTIL